MTAERRCRQCGAPVPPDAPRGSCPACLLRAGLDEDAEEEEVADGLVLVDDLDDEASTDGGGGRPGTTVGQRGLTGLDQTAGSMARLRLPDTEAGQEIPDVWPSSSGRTDPQEF